jgi:long-chain acyl-CoA synthetase
MLHCVTMDASTQPTFRRLPISRFAERTLPRLALASARRRGAAPFLHFIDPATPGAPPRVVTFTGFAEGVARSAALLERLGVGPGDRVLFLAENSPEWQMLALGAQALRAEPAALFTSLGVEAALGIARRVRPRVAVVSGPEAWAKLAPAAAELVAAGLRAIISTVPLPEVAVPAGLPVVIQGEALAAPGPGLELLATLAARAGEEDPFLLLFTSGTTGRPKGVRLPQRAIVHAIDAGNVAVAVGETDLGLHFLPFAHVAGHDQFALALALGQPLVMTARREDLERGLALGPTYLFSVPLVYERIREAVETKLRGLFGPLRRLARGALAGAARVRVDGSTAVRDRLAVVLADRLVGKGVRAKLGGHVRGLYAGGAPSSPALFRFYESLGMPFVELYGMSETAGMISSNLRNGQRRPGVAGLLTPDHEVRVGPDGELLLRGPLLLTGHLEADDDRAAFDAEGFFHTGDLVRADEEGFLRVEGRKKHVLVLSTGKKLSPEPIELAIGAAPGVCGAVLLGEGRPFVSAVVFVAREELSRLAAAGGDAAEALLPRVRAALSAFSEYEKPKRLLVVAGDLQEHPQLLTPTLKVKRDALLAWLGNSVGELYGTA